MCESSHIRVTCRYNSMKHTTIRIDSQLREKMKSLGKKSESYNDILCKVLFHVDECDRFWEDWK